MAVFTIFFFAQNGSSGLHCIKKFFECLILILFFIHIKLTSVEKSSNNDLKCKKNYFSDHWRVTRTFMNLLKFLMEIYLVVFLYVFHVKGA